MIIKPVQSMPPYQVNTADETVDEERRRNSKNQKDKEQFSPGEEKRAQSEATTEEVPTEVRQIVDSEKALELLSNRTQNTASVKKAFVSAQSKVKPATKSKINRTL